MASDFGIMSSARWVLHAVVTLPSKVFSYLWEWIMKIINGFRKWLYAVVTLLSEIYSYLWALGASIINGLRKWLDTVVTLLSEIYSYLWALGASIINGIYSYLWALGASIINGLRKFFLGLYALVTLPSNIINGLLRKLLSLCGTVPTIKVFTILTGNTLGSHESFRNRLSTRMMLVEKPSAEDCDVILAYCPIVSRVGTDIEAALSVIPNCRPAVLMVFHHTNDKYYIVPNTSRFTQHRGIQTVDCLFNDDGLLHAPRNDEAFRLAVEHLKVFQEHEMSSVLRLLSPLRCVYDFIRDLIIGPQLGDGRTNRY
ncbi:uncharacterized protein LOC134097593 isoform X2 [Sardina pilchardus]|uniref:uncharacterized protein LOC134097593 isoform X2 n=1 Tax=Sardina pilchardus TaxID=27697 RepID=UPI002E15D607